MKWFDWFTAAWLMAFLAESIFMGAWATFDAFTEPTQEHIHYVLASHLNQANFFLEREALANLELQHEGDNRYTGTAESSDGTIFSVKAELRNGRLNYAVKAENRGCDVSIPSPGFLERHPWSNPWLHISVIAVHTFGVIFPLAGLLGLRERFRFWIEVMLYVSAAGNLLLLVFQGSRLIEMYS